MTSPKLFHCTLLALFTLPLLAARVQAQKLSVQEVPLTTNHVLYDSFNGKVYASIPATAALNPNTVARINATTGAVETYIPMASGPDVLALSSDGSYLYVGTDGTSSVSRLNLTTNTVDQQFSLGTAPLAPQYTYHAGNIVPLPGMPQSVALTRDYFGISPANAGVGIFDNGVQRSNALNSGVIDYPLLIASNSPNRLYSCDNESSAFTFAQLNVDANGVTVGRTLDNVGANTIKFDSGNGFVYTSNGRVIDPVALTDVGVYPNVSTLASSGLFENISPVDVLPNFHENRVYFLIGPSGGISQGYGQAALRIYDQTAFKQLSLYVTPAAFTSIGDLYEISSSKFVFRSNQGVEFVSPQTASSITVTATSPEVAKAKTDQFTAIATYSDGSKSDITSAADWVSDNTNVATITSVGLVQGVATSTGLAQGVALGTVNITASLDGVTSAPVALSVTPVYYHVLWNNTSGAASIWNYDADTGSFSHKEYGPYTGWTAKTISDGVDDSLTRVLWDNTNGTASLWLLNDVTGSFSQFNYGPFSGWIANGLSVAAYSPDAANNVNTLLWTNSNGQVSLWSQYADDFGSFSQYEFGPYPDWTAKAIANSSDGAPLLLWDNLDGRMSVGDSERPSGLTSPLAQTIFGPYAGWTAIALSSPPNNTTTHILWTNTNGQMSLWNYDTLFDMFTQNTYGPYPGWNAKAIAEGSDGQTVILWNNTSGAVSIWSLNSATGSFTQHTFGPYSGWSATAISGGE